MHEKHNIQNCMYVGLPYDEHMTFEIRGLEL